MVGAGSKHGNGFGAVRSPCRSKRARRTKSVTTGFTGGLRARTLKTMISHPRDDSRQAPNEVSWESALSHRPPEERTAAATRFEAAGLSAEQVQAVLADGGDRLYAAASASAGRPGWTAPFGGTLAVALLAAEVGALAAQLGRRASGIRSLAAADLLEDFSAVTVAEELGVSRQKIYEIARGGLRGPHLDNVPWRSP